MKSTSTTALAPLLQQFFVERLQKQRQASPCTIRAYRDAFRLFLMFIEAKLHKRPADLAKARPFAERVQRPDRIPIADGHRRRTLILTHDASLMLGHDAALG